ncbi:MAG: 16S rRNA (guanine(966)-N(2))-methyltransferase RsmD [bacterium]|nr:16S rRNA (guanine(966)-N(2))-methyltransferase RsmD [bacterium]
MRVISGKYKGKKLLGYDIEGTRPTQDRVKESLFAMIQSDLMDATVLDLFAGSGNLGIEALSNGANQAYFVDYNSKCIEALNYNLKSISVSATGVLQLDYKKALNYFREYNLCFDIIFLDPPYTLECLDGLLQKINEYGLLKADGLIVCEYEFAQFQENYLGLELEKEKTYGYKHIRIYRKVSL